MTGTGDGDGAASFRTGIGTSTPDRILLLGQDHHRIVVDAIENPVRALARR